jgi:hypothetical protein
LVATAVIIGAFVNIGAASTIRCKAWIARAFVGTRKVQARAFASTIIISAFIDVGACDSLAEVSVWAGAFETAGGVGADAVGMAVVGFLRCTFIVIDTFEAIACESQGTGTTNFTEFKCAAGPFMASTIVDVALVGLIATVHVVQQVIPFIARAFIAAGGVAAHVVASTVTSLAFV